SSSSRTRATSRITRSRKSCATQRSRTPRSGRRLRPRHPWASRTRMSRNVGTVFNTHEAAPIVRSVAGRWLPVVPVALYALIVYPFVYRDVVGEPDLERMLMAVIYGATTGLGEAAGFHYDLPVSFGYYGALYHLLPLSVLLHSTSLITAMNFIGFGSAVASLAFLALYAVRLFGPRVAFLAGMLF